MKKILILITCLLAAPTIALADDDKPITVDQLPARAQQFIQQHFSGVKISYAKQDSDWFDKNYEVFFVDGNKVEFRKNGDWKEVDCQYNEIPAGIVPAEIDAFVAQNHTGRKIVKIDRDSRDYEVELDNDLDLKFDMRYNLIGYDD